ncbi:hypothetical protein AAFN88_10000 [Pelagibius sp. CAU 1746]|uniref:hypothetical protein n=1 Tax=Pelagibius sp. CAU 1746 TaxID=3140370 RepID=UPI00325A88C7
MTPSDDSLAAARALLAPGETLVWADRPDPQVLARSRLPQVIRGALGLVVIAGFFWLSFLPNWPAGGRGLLLTFFLLAAVLYCLWLLAAQVTARKAAVGTLYAVTDRRVLVQETWPLRRLRSFAPGDLDAPMVSAAGPGFGTVVFHDRKLPWWQRSAGGGTRIEAFYGIAGAQRVAEEIARLRGAPQTGSEFPDEDT